MNWRRGRWPSAGSGHRPPAATGPGSRRSFGATWWGTAWLIALEERAQLDPNRLSRGRGYARSGAVEALEITPGLVRADVQGSRAQPYQVTVRVRELDAAEWDRVFDAVAAELGHTAALLDGELPSGVADDVAATGLDLLPGAGEMQPRCSCPDWADPCKHAAAVCYLVADALDADPFALLRLRGRDRDEVLAGLRTRRRARLTPAAGIADPTAANPAIDEGIGAREAYQRTPAPLPAPPLPPARPGRPAVLPADPPPGLAREDLVALAADAAARSLELATGVGDGGLGLTEQQDLARRGAALLGGPGFAALAITAGVPARTLASDAIAWRHGGIGGLAVLHDTWQPDPEALAEGRAALDHYGELGTTRAYRNRLTRGSVQLRLGQDALWYRLSRSGPDWDLDAAPHPDPTALLTPPP